MPNDITGTIQIKNGKYFAVLNLRHPDGSRKQKWITTGLEIRNNKRAAEKRLREIIAEYEERNQLFDSDMLFWKLMEEWLESIRLKVRDSTYHNYKLVAEAHIIPYFKDLNIKAKDLLPRDLEKYYAEMLKTLSPVTVQKHHANIHSALEYGRKNRIVPTNVAKDVQLKKASRKQKGSFYTTEQIKTLLEAAQGDPIEVPIMLIAQFGMRRSEALGLKWSDIDFANHLLTIHATVVYVGTETTFVEGTKSEASERTLPIAPSVEAYLKSVRQKQLYWKEVYGSAYHDDGYICTRDDGTVIKPNLVTGRFKKIIEKCGLPAIRLHDLRHSAATNLLAQGFSIKDVSEFLGHADISTTLNIYGHVLQEHKFAMAEALSVTLSRSA